MKVIANLQRYIHYYVCRVNNALRYRNFYFGLECKLYFNQCFGPGSVIRIRIQEGINDTRKKKHVRVDLGILFGGLNLGSY